MRKIILDLAVSLDGFIEGVNGEIDWCILDEEVSEELLKLASRIDTVLYGRISYEGYGNYSPADTASDFEKQFYGQINRMHKVVFTRREDFNPPGATVIRNNIKDAVTQLKSQPGKDIWLFGGASLISALIAEDLVDEYRIAVHPVVLGAGKPLFSNVKERINLGLTHTRAFSSGLVGLYYQRS